MNTVQLSRVRAFVANQWGTIWATLQHVIVHAVASHLLDKISTRRIRGTEAARARDRKRLLREGKDSLLLCL